MRHKPPRNSSRARVDRPERFQVEWRPMALDQMLPANHQARAVWQFVQSLDLSPLYEKIRAVEGGPGRNAVAPEILLALWMLATIEGISSARHLDRLCERDMPYMWICGGVSVNHDLISAFRTDHAEFLNQLLTESVATLLHHDVVRLENVAQDGMRVRASAGKSSFRRKPTLEQLLDIARTHVETLNRERQDEAQNETSNRRQKAAQERAVQEREERVTKALEELEKLQKQKEERKKGTGSKARASTTDPEARVMKMANGGFNPAYNVQFVTDTTSRIIVHVDVTNSGSDRGEMAPGHAAVSERYGQTPKEYVVDCGYATKDDITTLEQRGTHVIAPIHDEERMKKKNHDPYSPQRGDTREMMEFRRRMETSEAKAKYRLRPSVAEFPNAECRNRGLQQFRVRGLKKVRVVALLYAITFNFMRMRTLGCLK